MAGDGRRTASERTTEGGAPRKAGNGRRTGSERDIEAAAQALFAQLNGACYEAKRSRDVDALDRLARARKLIEAEPSAPLDLEAIARRACLSPYHFHRLFRRQYGVTPHRYLTDRRVARARELLRTTELSVTEICLEVGFSSLGSFSTLFRRHVGHPPARYRRRLWQVRWDPRVQVPWCFFSAYASARVERPGSRRDS